PGHKRVHPGQPYVCERMGKSMRLNTKRTSGLLIVLMLGCQKPAEAPAESAKTEPEKPAESAAALKKDTGPVKVGILHSLSGTMAISETSLKDTALMAIEEINARGGLLGRKL